MKNKVTIRVCSIILFLVTTGSPLFAANWFPLSDTGQKKCYDVAGAQIVCPSKGDPLYGQDAQYNGRQQSYTSLTIGNDIIVIDNNTKLTWQQNTADINNDGTIYYQDDMLSRQNAINYCDSLVFGGYDDWRLPEIEELASITDYTRDPPVNAVFGAMRNIYKAQTLVRGDGTCSWVIYLAIPRLETHYTVDNARYVRCVRGEKSIIGSYVDNGNTVTDISTGLIWMKNTLDYDNNGNISNSDMVSWDKALEQCENLSLDNMHWRLPNITELSFLADRHTEGLAQAINPIFQSVSNKYWTSTTSVPWGGDKAWTVNFASGSTDQYMGKTSNFYVRWGAFPFCRKSSSQLKPSIIGHW